MDRRRRVLVYGGFPHRWSTLVLSSFQGETRCSQTPRPPGSWWGRSLDEMLPSCGRKRDRPTPTRPSHQTGSRQVPGNGRKPVPRSLQTRAGRAPRRSPEGQVLPAGARRTAYPRSLFPAGGRKTCRTINNISWSSKYTDF